MTSIAAAAYSTFAIKSDGETGGTLWSWGDNYYGELGDGTYTNHSSPRLVPGLTQVMQVALEVGHGIAVKSNGTVWTWGANNWGQLGDSTNNAHPSPIQAQVPLVTSVAAGGLYSLVLQSPGPRAEPVVWGWGYNAVGQLGTGNANTSNNPVKNLATDLIALNAAPGGH